MLKKAIFSICLTLIAFCGFSQNKGIPISVGYYAPYFIQLGGKVGTHITLKEWEAESETNQNLKRLLLNPQLGYFTQPSVRQNYLMNTELAFHLSKTERKRYYAPSLGLGYLVTSKFIDGDVNLGTGEINRNKETGGSFLPTVNFEMGWKNQQKLGYFLKAFYGRKFSASEENSGFFGLELGVKFEILKKG